MVICDLSVTFGEMLKSYLCRLGDLTNSRKR